MKSKKSKSTEDEVQRRPGWSIYEEPKFNKIEPQPNIIIERYSPLLEETGSRLKLSEVTLPKGVTWDNVIIDTEEGIITISEIQKTSRPNHNYEKALRVYNKEKEKYLEEVKLWKKWKEQEEKRILDNHLKEAEQLLKKHGKL